MMYEYQLVKHSDMGYAVYKYNTDGMFWQQISKWYWYYGNLKRFFIEPNNIGGMIYRRVG